MNSSILLYLKDILNGTKNNATSVASVLSSLSPLSSDVSNIKNQCTDMGGIDIYTREYF